MLRSDKPDYTGLKYTHPPHRPHQQHMLRPGKPHCMQASHRSLHYRGYPLGKVPRESSRCMHTPGRHHQCTAPHFHRSLGELGHCTALECTRHYHTKDSGHTLRWDNRCCTGVENTHPPHRPVLRHKHHREMPQSSSAQNRFRARSPVRQQAARCSRSFPVHRYRSDRQPNKAA